MTGEHPPHGQLDRFLDHPHTEVGQYGGLPKEIQIPGPRHPAAEQGADGKRGEDALRGDHRIGALQRVHHERDRNQETAEQDDRRNQVGVPGHDGDQHGGPPQPDSGREDSLPAWPRPADPTTVRAGVGHVDARREVLLHPVTLQVDVPRNFSARARDGPLRPPPSVLLRGQLRGQAAATPR